MSTPAALFANGPGWKPDTSHRTGEAWVTSRAMCGSVAEMWLSEDGASWHCCWGRYFDCRSQRDEAECVESIRSFIIEHRDELVKLTRGKRPLPVAIPESGEGAGE